MRAITGDAGTGDPGISNSAELIAFVDAAVVGEPEMLGPAREALRHALGSRAVVDTAAVIGEFERMGRSCARGSVWRAVARAGTIGPELRRAR